MAPIKPLGHKSYGSIGHLPESRLGPGDHKIEPGQASILTRRTRDKNDLIIVQEKLDGSNVGVANINGEIVALTRAGYRANDSHYPQHMYFHLWVQDNYARFVDVLKPGERLCGEWLIQAHGTMYNLPHEPFVIFDLIRGQERALFEELRTRINDKFTMPYLVHIDYASCDVGRAMTVVDMVNKHGAIDPIEGMVFRCERKGKVEFLAKYVRPGKIDGKYLEFNTYNTWAGEPYL